MIKPQRLKPGDTVALVSLSGGAPERFPIRYRAGIAALEKALDVTVIEMPHAIKSGKWLARNPEARADDLHKACADPKVRAIISTVGGEDSIRLLRYLNPDIIRNNPKIFLGYSDSTVSHLLYYSAKVVSFYGPNIMGPFAEPGGVHEYMLNSLRRTICEEGAAGIIHPNSDGWTSQSTNWSENPLLSKPRHLRQDYSWNWLQGTNVVKGHLLGGCLEVLDWLRGTSVWPSREQWRGALLFVETSTDMPPPSAVSRMFRSLAAQGIFELVRGVLVGRPGGDLNPETFREYDQAILSVIRDEEGHEDIPVVTCMDFGHSDPIMTLPYGVQAKLDCFNRTFEILEPAVSSKFLDN